EPLFPGAPTRSRTIEGKVLQATVDQMLGRLPAGGDVVQCHHRANLRIPPAGTVHVIASLRTPVLKYRKRNAPENRAVELWPGSPDLENSLHIFEEDPASLEVRVAGDAAKNRAPVS